MINNKKIVEGDPIDLKLYPSGDNPRCDVTCCENKSEIVINRSDDGHIYLCKQCDHEMSMSVIDRFLRKFKDYLGKLLLKHGL